MNPADWIAIVSGALNFFVLLIAALINTKIANLQTSIYKDFLTKKDYFEFQNRRSYIPHPQERKR